MTDTCAAYRRNSPSVPIQILSAGCPQRGVARAAQECEALAETALPGDGSNPDRFAEQSRYALACMSTKDSSPGMTIIAVMEPESRDHRSTPPASPERI